MPARAARLTDAIIMTASSMNDGLGFAFGVQSEEE
jgi:hypothetical protein